MRSAAEKRGAGVEVGGLVVISAAVPSLEPRQAEHGLRAGHRDVPPFQRRIAAAMISSFCR